VVLGAVIDFSEIFERDRVSRLYENHGKSAAGDPRGIMRRSAPLATITLALFAAIGLLSPGMTGRLGADDKAEKKPDKVVRVLFLGNSLTAVNDVPAMVQAMAATGGVHMHCKSFTPGGVSLEDHWQSGEGRKLLVGSKWNYLVLQQGPSSRPESQVNLREWAIKWADEARAHGAEPALYMVWPFDGQNDGFKLVAQSYREAANASKSLLFPAGEAWAKALNGSNPIQLYQPDKLHPTLAGSYLAALVITQGLTKVKPSAIPSKLILPSGKTITLPEDQAKVLRECAEKTVEEKGTSKSTQPDK